MRDEFLRSFDGQKFGLVSVQCRDYSSLSQNSGGIPEPHFLAIHFHESKFFSEAQRNNLRWFKNNVHIEQTKAARKFKNR